MLHTDIVIIDSGLSVTFLDNTNVNGVCIEQESGNKFAVSSDINDQYGHGTAIYNIIRSHNKEADVYVIKAIGEEGISETTLRYVLEYILKNIDCKIINMSLGTCSLDKTDEIHRLCQALLDRGTFIVSAFDNSGAISFPAVFDNVIGVISSASCLRSSEFECYEGSFVNYGADGNNQRVRWLNQKISIAHGNSFACAHMTGIISNIPLEYRTSLNSISLYLKDQAKQSFSFQASATPPSISIVGHKACIFPFNKEIHSLLRFEDYLSFQIVDVFDSRYSARIGASTNSLLGICNEKDHIIKPLEQIDCANFDFLILGHFDQLIQRKSEEALLQKVVLQCIDRGIQVFSFDCLSKLWGERFNSIHSLSSPEIDCNKFNTNPFGMLYRIPKPVLGIFGTSSQQGKFTLQLFLRYLFQKDGYTIGQLGSEPSAALFGMDECFHYGYNSLNELNGPELIKYVNFLMYRILATKRPDIILVGAQSGILPWEFGNINGYATKQINYLLATNPDKVVLCINALDTVECIARTIGFIESVVDCEVIALVVFPQIYDTEDNAPVGFKKVSAQKYSSLKNKLIRHFSRKVFLLGDEAEMKRLYSHIIDSFA